MNHPQSILVPWLVFAAAVALKLWQFGQALKRHLVGPGPTPSADQVRQSLERIWQQEAQAQPKWKR